MEEEIIIDTVDTTTEVTETPQFDTSTSEYTPIEISEETSEDVPLDIEKVDWDAEYQREIIAELIAHIDEIEKTNQELNEKVSSTEEILASKETSLSELNTQLTALMEQASIVEELESQWNKVKEFETVWPLVAAIVEGKEVNIPKYLEMYVKEQLLAMPQFEDTKKPQVDTSSVKQVNSLSQAIKNLNGNFT